jgi:hypothetical protein
MIRHLRTAQLSTPLNAGIAVYARRYGLQPADRIKESIFQTGLTKHHSIYLGIDQYGQEWIAENHKLLGVRLLKANDYFKPKDTYSVVPFEGSYSQRIAAVKRALVVLGNPYDLILYNCEHYASYVQTGKAESKQVNNALLAAITLLFIGIVASE